jgi:hypothetical protein
MHPEIGNQVRIKVNDLEAAFDAYLLNNRGAIVDGEIVEVLEEEDTDDLYYVNIRLPRVGLYKFEFTPAARRIKK